MSIPIRLKSIPVWEPRWGVEALKKKCAEQRQTFERGFRLVALSEDERTFPSFERCYSYGVSLGEIQRSNWVKVTGVDLAGKKRPGNAIFTLAIDPSTSRRYPIDIRHGAWRSHETAAQIAEVNLLYRPNVIMVESNAYQQAIIDWCQANKGSNDFWMKLEPTTTGEEKMDPELGLPGIQVELDNGGWVIARDKYETHEVSCPCSWCLWDREMRNHPVAAQMDTVMACWFARQGAERYGRVIDSSAPVGDLRTR